MLVLDNAYIVSVKNMIQSYAKSTVYKANIIHIVCEVKLKQNNIPIFLSIYTQSRFDPGMGSEIQTIIRELKRILHTI